jgi:large subunit ribosomal protein L19
VGDTVSVRVQSPEAGRTRARRFTGVVIARRAGCRGQGSLTVRRWVDGEGVERTFPRASPDQLQVKVHRHGRTRRAKLFYLRDRVGKRARLAPVFASPAAKPRRRRRGAKAKAARRARRAAEERRRRDLPDAGAAGVLAKLRPTDPPFVPPRPRSASRTPPQDDARPRS